MSVHPTEALEPGAAHARTRFGLMLLPVQVPFHRLEATARAADAAGFDGLWLFDHLDTPHAEPGSPTLDVYEGWTTAALLGARTERIHIGHNVLCSSFRHPALLAKMAATLDVATGGRIELGLGWGSMPDELRRFGFGVESGSVRAQRMAETLDILELMFTGEPFSYAGRHYTLSDAVGRPRPVNGRIPIQIGGVGPKLTLPLVARYADWWNCPSNGLDRFHELEPLIGRARVALQVVVGLAGSSRGRAQVAAEAEQRFAATWGSGVTGTPDEVALQLGRFVDLGVEQLIIQFTDYGRPETIDLFAREVIPAVHAARATARSAAVDR